MPHYSHAARRWVCYQAPSGDSFTATEASRDSGRREGRFNFQRHRTAAADHGDFDLAAKLLGHAADEHGGSDVHCGYHQFSAATDAVADSLYRRYESMRFAKREGI